MEKEQLIQVIKEWVKNDNELRTLHREQQKRKLEKKKITQNLIEIMRNNNIDCFDINDGQIMYKKKEVKQAITKSHLMNVLSTFYNGDSEKVNELNTFIMENRKSVTKETISRKLKDSELVSSSSSSTT